jgi:hypothetical protein
VPAAAALNWVLKDGLGRLGKLTVSTKFGRTFDSDLKRSRFTSSVVYDLAALVEMCTPLAPGYFLALATSANIKAAGQTGGQVIPEVTGMFPPWSDSKVEPQHRQPAGQGERRRMDLVLQRGLELLFGDPTVVDGVLAADVRARETNPDAPRAVLAAEQAKRDYYGPDLPPGTVFYPAAHDTLSGCGPGAEALQRRLAHLVAEKANGGIPPSARLIGLKAQDLRERVGIAVMRGVANAVMQGAGEGLLAAIAAAKKKQTNRWNAPHPLRFEDGSAH